MTEATIETQDWPPRPENEAFPPVLDTVLVGQLLLYDRRGNTLNQARRNVRRLVAECGLPTLGRVGNGLLFDRDAVIDWIRNRKGAESA